MSDPSPDAPPGETLDAAGEEALAPAALDAFVRFTEAVGATTDPNELAREAVRVLHARFEDASVAYHVPRGDRWAVTEHSGDIPPEVLAEVRVGVPADIPIVAEALRSRAPVFVDRWNPIRSDIVPPGAYGTTSLYPIVLHGEVVALLGVARRRTRRWAERDKDLLRAVGRGLTLALLRARDARELRERSAEVERRNATLEAFADLARDLAFETDAYALVQRALDVACGLLPPGFALYYEPEGDHWRMRASSGALPDGLAQVVSRGLPWAEARNLLVPWETREAHYQDVYDPATDGRPEVTRTVRATATLPVLTGGAPRGVFAVALTVEGRWSRADRAVLETAVRSLGGALERAEQAARLEANRRALVERTRALTLANEELEAFAYSVSHDLRAPVRHVASFAQMLRRSLGDGAPPRALHHLDVIEGAAGRMDALIEALLGLSRTTRAPLRLGPVDLGTLVERARLDLAPDAVGRAVEWHLGALPVVRADPDTLQRAVTNLLSNALKYTRTREVAVVEVWAEDTPDEVRVCVRDNGVGFDPRYADKLFGVFQRLHRQEDFEGTGVGLSLVRRVVQRHGGRVWAEGAVDGGALFAFSLPKD